MDTNDTALADTLFEVSWEVCNKVGGIYTVIQSKVPFVQKYYKRYITIGPQLDHPSQEFDEREAPDDLKSVFAVLDSQGIKCKYGVWLITGQPETILLDFKGVVGKKDALKLMYWEQFKIDSLKASWEFEEPLCFSTAAGMLIEEYARQHSQVQNIQPQMAIPNSQERIVAHCHEWIAGFTLLYLHYKRAPVATVFTTHATMLGRSIAGNGYSLYEIIDTINPMEWAYKLNVQEKHTAEVACAHTADVFTTVSEITGMEAEKLLGKKPDVLLYNGFHIDSFPTFEETSIRHLQSKELLKEFAAYTFFPYYSFDLDKTLFFFTSGRYEFQNKGMDVFIESLGRLNDRLRKEGSNKTIVVFFWVLMGRGGVRDDLLENKSFYQNVKSTVDWKSKQITQRLVLDILSGHRPGEDDFFTSTLISDLYSGIRRLHRTGTPTMVTHDIGSWDNDPIVKACIANGLVNKEEDRVKVLLYPGALDGADGLLNISYYDAVVGTHLGVFASAYEPWGYTPMENGVLGVPAITTDLAGYGRYLSSTQQAQPQGQFILSRLRKSHEEVVFTLAERLYWYSTIGHVERVQLGFYAKSLANTCDWGNFVKNYIAAHNLAYGKHS